MFEIGKVNKLKVIEKATHGFYLEGDENWGDVLLPNKYVPAGLKLNDEIDVFIYFDSKDSIIATTKMPYASVGDFAALKVSAIEENGIFLDWGLDKNLFVPFREQVYEMQEGNKYVVYIYLDNSQRIAASTRLTKFIDKSRPDYLEGEEVELLICQKTDLGFKAIINGQYYGQIYNDDIIHNLKLGQSVKGYIRKIRDDDKIDLSLQAIDLDSSEDLPELIIKELKAAGGFLAINSKTSAETINATFKVSRKKFKIALGSLYKKKIISTDDTGIRLL